MSARIKLKLRASFLVLYLGLSSLVYFGLPLLLTIVVLIEDNLNFGCEELGRRRGVGGERPPRNSLAY